jgi:hypothetical protein
LQSDLIEYEKQADSICINLAYQDILTNKVYSGEDCAAALSRLGGVREVAILLQIRVRCFFIFLSNGLHQVCL